MEEREFASLEEVTQALEEEVRLWNKKGMSLTPIHPQRLPESLLEYATKIQAITNLLIVKGLITEDEINFEFRKIMYTNMTMIRESFPEQQSQQIRNQIIQAAHIPPNGFTKPPWER